MLGLNPRLTRTLYTVLVVLLALFVGSCGPATSSLSSVVPYGVDLSGIWVLDETRSDAPPDNEAALQRLKAAEIEGKRSDAFGSILYATQDFPVIAADRLSVEQDSSSISISYGDGQHRDLIWGLQTRAEWKVDAGWEQSRLVVKSFVSHTSGTERYQLDSDGDTLLVDVSVRAGPDRRNFRRTYTRSQ